MLHSVAGIASRCLHSLVAVSIPFLAAGCTAERALPRSTESVSTLSSTLDWDDLKIGPGDVIQVGLLGRPELSMSGANHQNGVMVGADGALCLPLAGVVRVQGLSIEEARAAITAAFARYVKNPRVDVNVIEYASRRFYLYGEVAKPGAYTIDRPLTLYQALALGGGFTSRARRSEVVLLRGTPEHLEVVTFDGETPEATGMSLLKPDDFVFVRRSGAGKFSDELLPILSGIGSTLSSVATVILIQDRLSD